MENSEKFQFKSLATGREYGSENPIDEQSKKNVLFSEKVRGLEEIRSFSNIPQILLDAGPEETGAFEAALRVAGLPLESLLDLRRRPQVSRDQAERCVQGFFGTKSPSMREALVKDLVNLLK